MATPADPMSPGTARKLLHKLRNAKHVVAVWTEQLADSLSCADMLCKKINRVVAQAVSATTSSNPGDQPAVTDAAKHRNGVLHGMLSDAEGLVAKLERCWDDSALAQNALEGAQAAAEELVPEHGPTPAVKHLLSHALSMSASACTDFEDADMTESESSGEESAALREVISVLQAQIRGAQELLLHHGTKHSMVDRAICTSDLTEEEAPVQLQEVVEVLQAQMRAAGAALSDRVGQVRRLERHLSRRQETTRVPEEDEEGEREEPSPQLPDQRDVIQVLQAQVTAANEQLALRSRELEELRAELAAARQLHTHSQALPSTATGSTPQPAEQDDGMDADGASEHSEEGLEYHRLDDEGMVGQPDTPRSDDVLFDRDARSPPPADLGGGKILKMAGYTLLAGEVDSRTMA